jgi:hypothetical protein
VHALLVSTSEKVRATCRALRALILLIGKLEQKWTFLVPFLSIVSSYDYTKHKSLAVLLSLSSNVKYLTEPRASTPHAITTIFHSNTNVSHCFPPTQFSVVLHQEAFNEPGSSVT